MMHNHDSMQNITFRHAEILNEILIARDSQHMNEKFVSLPKNKESRCKATMGMQFSTRK